MDNKTETNIMDPLLLVQLVTMEMPFGKYKGTVLYRLPVSYLEWFMRQGGFPKGTLGTLLATLYEIRLNGLEELLDKIASDKNIFPNKGL